MLNIYNYHKEKLDKYDEYYTNISLCTSTGFYNNPDYDFTPILHIIKRVPGVMVSYAQYILKDRWLEVEPIIMTNAGAAILYAKYVIRGRWVEAESIIIKFPYLWDNYCRDLGI